MEQFIQNFGLSGLYAYKQDLCNLIPKMVERWPQNRYDNATKMINIKSYIINATRGLSCVAGGTQIWKRAKKRWRGWAFFPSAPLPFITFSLSPRSKQTTSYAGYQRINCETFFKLWSEKCKMLCYINHDILVTKVTKWTQ